MKIELATPEVRESLFQARAALWKYDLSAEHYITRNHALYSHPFGKKRMETYVLREDSGKIVASMDFLSVRIASQQGTSDGFLIASVMTPVEERKKGYASYLLTERFKENRHQPKVLYSDIDPKFYARYGFHEKWMYAVETSVRSVKTHKARSISSDTFLEKLKLLRQSSIKKTPISGALEVDSELLDWHLERYRSFAKSAKMGFPEDVYHLCERGGDHPIAAVPQYLYRRLEVLWMNPECTSCLEMIHSRAEQLQMKKILYWTSREPKKGVFRKECPMLYLPNETNPTFVDPQFLDSW